MSKLLMLEEMHEQDFYPNRSAYEALDFIIENNDNLFLITLPQNWDISSKTGNLCTLIDSKGIARGTCKYKDGFGSFISLEPRFNVSYTYTEPQNVTSHVHVYVQDLLTKEIICDIGDCEKANSDEFRELVKKANELLDSIYPGWSDPSRYWD